MKCRWRGKTYTLYARDFRYGWAQIKGGSGISLYVPIREVTLVEEER